MHLYALQYRAQMRPSLNVVHSIFAQPLCGPGLSPRATRQQPRAVTVKSSKATSLDWDDLRNALPRADPEKRLLNEVNYRRTAYQCQDWATLHRLEADLRERYDRQPGVALAVLVRASELVDMEVAGEAERREVKKMLDTSLAPFIVNKGIYSFKARELPQILSALAALQYSNPRLNNALLKLLESGVDSLMAHTLLSAFCSATQLGLRLGPRMLDKVGARVDFTLPHCGAEEFGCLATALAPYKKLAPSLDKQFLRRLADRCQPHLPDLSGEQLVDLLLIFVRQDFPLHSQWVASFQSALVVNLPGLTQPRSYAALLFSLAKASLAITEDFLEALLNRLAEPASTSAAAGSRRPRPGGSNSSLLSSMRPGDLAVVASVLSIYGYPPAAEWAAEYVEALEVRAADMDAQQVVTIVDACQELNMPLSPDLLDEMLAVAEEGLGQLPAPRLLQLVAALGAGEHRPDGPWLRHLGATLVALAGRCEGAYLGDVIAALPYVSYAFPADGEMTAAVLAAVQARAVALKGGVDETTRASIQRSLQQLGHPSATAFADSLVPQSPPPPTPAASPVGKDTFVTTAAAAVAGSCTGPAASAAFGSSPAAAAYQGQRQQQQQIQQQQVAASSPSNRRRAPSSRFEAAEDEDEDEEFKDEEPSVYGRRLPAAPRAAPPPPAMVASSRGDRRRRGVSSRFDDEEGVKEEEDEDDDEEDQGGYGLAGRRDMRRAAAPPPPPSRSGGGVGGGGGPGTGGFVGSTRAPRRI